MGARALWRTDLLSRHAEYRRDCHFFLAETHFKLGAYRAARLHNDALLADEPRNQQALQLRERIEHQLTQGGCFGEVRAGWAI